MQCDMRASQQGGETSMRKIYVSDTGDDKNDGVLSEDHIRA
jgi:hypothetical protein